MTKINLQANLYDPITRVINAVKTIGKNPLSFFTPMKNSEDTQVQEELEIDKYPYYLYAAAHKYDEPNVIDDLLIDMEMDNNFRKAMLEDEQTFSSPAP